MLKAVGILCILSGSTGLGMAFARELEMRVSELRQLWQMMLLLQGEIRYMRRPLPDAFLHLSQNAPEPLRAFFLHAARELGQRSGQSAEEIWQRNMKRHLAGLHISRQERKDMERLGSMLGCLDVQMQVNLLDYYLEQLKHSMHQAQEALKNRRRIYQCMGALGGAALAVMIF